MQLTVASRKDRVLSLVIDMAMTSVVMITSYWIVFATRRPVGQSAADLRDMIYVVGMLCHILYLTIGYHRYGRTVGSRVVGIRVLSPDGNRLSLWRSMERAGYVAFMPLIAGLLSLPKNEAVRRSKTKYGKLQTSLWDHIAHSITVESK
ncbi:RDD family protein [bacterium]|nr:RDD family protein [bacterium]